MNKRFVSILSILLCLLLCLQGLPVAYAEEAEETEPLETEEMVEAAPGVVITTAQELLELAENCRLDSFSAGLVVSLEADIDLSATEFAGIPIFCGTFEGNGHTISGLELTEDGSVQGLFRYLTATALVRDLTVTGQVLPAGSRGTVGGIAGSNAGRIENCTFSGDVSGSENVGGLVGINTVSGIIDGCRVTGTIHGSHFVGGIAGENSGVIRNCENYAQINITVQQNSVEISDITMDTLSGSESVATVTDIGGIAGTNGGVIRSCINSGDVGYKHMGYNIGGIAGSHRGYIVDCTNTARINGRKEVGGIVGQMEPVSRVDFSADTLQILQGQLNTMGSLANQTVSSAQNSANTLQYQMNTLESQAKAASDAVDMLTPDLENPSLPDMDSITAAQNSLSSNLSGMSSTMQSMTYTTQNAVTSMASNLQALTNQMNAISGTLSNATENLGGTITDVSDADTAEELTGKVEGCMNLGSVLADMNAGGIAGAISIENDLDPDDDLQLNGDVSMNFESELRAVVLLCENRGGITVVKQNAGGIVGLQTMGLVKECTNTGALDAEDADYVGGISGQSNGYIRACYVKCQLMGRTYVGGIGGTGATVSDCRSMVSILGGTEKLGAVLGYARESYADTDTPVAGNFYLLTGTDTGAIDGISYDGCAQSLSREEFLALEGLPELFRSVRVEFVYEDGTRKTLTLAPGAALDSGDIPAVPDKSGWEGAWEGLEEADLSSVLFDLTFQASYTALEQVIASSVTRENGSPVVLAQGQFLSGQTVTLEMAPLPAQTEEDHFPVEAWEFSVPGNNTEKIRYALPQAYASEELRMLVKDEHDTWREVEFAVEGSYLVFQVSANDRGFCLVYVPADYSGWLYLTAGAVVVLLAALLTGGIVKRIKKKKEAK